MKASIILSVLLFTEILMAASCGEERYPVNYQAPQDAGVDAGCVVEGEDGAQFAPSTTAWWAPSCWPDEPGAP